MYFALDFGGTNFRISWTDTLENPDIGSNVYIIKNLGKYQRDSKSILDFMKSKSVTASGIAIAIPGSFDLKEMNLIGANNLKGWIGKPFFRQLRQYFDCDLIAEKDSVMAAIGEGLSLSSINDNFLYLTWGTGIGGCTVSNNNCSNELPEITILDWEKTFKQIENNCSGGHAVSNFGVELKELSLSQWNLLIENFVDDLKIICDKLNLRNVVIGGGIADKRSDIVSKIQSKLEQQEISMVRSQLGDLSALYGGYAILRSKCDQSLFVKTLLT